MKLPFLKCLALTLLFVRPLFSASFLYSQTVTAVIADEKTKEGIPFGFVFLANSSIGATTDVDGHFELELPEGESGSLVFSHLNYESKTVAINRRILQQDTFFLLPKDMDLGQVEVVNKSKPRIKKKRLRRFVDAFLGDEIDDEMVRIQNPEVLLFQEEEDRLIAEASDALLIENRELGYQVQFFLEAFEMNKNNDVLYRGNTFFQPLDGNEKEQARFERNRKKVYEMGSRHFFANLVAGTINPEEYDIQFSTMDSEGQFTGYGLIHPDSIIVEKRKDDTYTVYIRGYLTVTCKEVSASQTDVKPPAYRDFSTGIKTIEKQELNQATSFLKSWTDKIMVNTSGKILNPGDVEERGFWANQRVGSLLPFDYEGG